MLVLACILLALATVALVLSPLLAHRTAPLTDGPDEVAELRELYALKEVVYETLRDLEFDFHAGKIGESDYRDLSDRYTREAISAVQRIDDLEARLPELRARRRART